MRSKIIWVMLTAAVVPVFAEHEFALSLAPAFEVPAGKEHFGPGAGAAAVLRDMKKRYFLTPPLQEPDYIVAPGETSPANPDDLRKSFFTKREKDVIEFDFGDSGKTAYFAVQIENEGKKGPWGPLVSALIP